jgi:hypothetical protein
MSERTREQQEAGGRQQAAGQREQGQPGQPGAGNGQQPGSQQGQQQAKGQRPGRQDAQGTSGTQGGEGGEATGPGERAGDRQQAEGSSVGRPPEAGGGGGGRPGRVDPEQVRQLRREARERGGEAEQLRRDMRALGMSPGEIDRLIRDLRALDSDRIYEDRAALAKLQAALVEGFRRLEFDLRRRLDAGGEVLLSGAEDVPPEYRSLVEEYYRSLAREGRREVKR